MIVSAIVAMTPSRLMGHAGKLPWHISEDLRHFKHTTSGHAVLMGRKTFESIGSRPLPNRRNLIVSRDAPRDADVTPRPSGATVEWFTSIPAAIDAVRVIGTETELFIVGGSQIYAAAMPLTDRLYITWVQISPEPAGDTWFPEMDMSQWREHERRTLTPQAELVVYDRK